MAFRCGCGGGSNCSCTLVGGDGVDISGTGTKSNPYVLSAVIPTSGGGGGDRFSGEIVAYGGAVAPSGWLVCDGSAVSRAVYAGLFTAIGVAYGAGDGSTTFNLPDLTGRFPLGLSGTYPRGGEGGGNSAVLTTENLPSHTHGINHDHAAFNTASSGAHNHTSPSQRNDADGATSTIFRMGASSGAEDIPAQGSHTHSIDVPAYTGASGATGTGAPVNTMPAFSTVLYIVKA